MEIIEIGAVYLDSSRGPVVDEFARFVRPVLSPKLSQFCKKLTSITQVDVDGAETFFSVFNEFLNWIGDAPFVLCSWGAYDLNQFRSDCTRHGIQLPESFERHINLKEEFARLYSVRSCGMAAALKRTGLPLKGTHHRGIDDARNIAELAKLILPYLEEE
jgi:inhibitor of KinA sporulation pathway (predicted exonuclease)